MGDENKLDNEPSGTEATEPRLEEYRQLRAEWASFIGRNETLANYAYIGTVAIYTWRNFCSHVFATVRRQATSSARSSSGQGFQPSVVPAAASWKRRWLFI
jgi:hypothetical protein